MRGWLTLRTDETEAERIAVLVGAQIVGFLNETETSLHTTEWAPLRSSIEAQKRRGKALWVAVFFEVEDGRYTTAVSIP
jgi:hypothetical protein